MPRARKSPPVQSVEFLDPPTVVPPFRFTPPNWLNLTPDTSREAALIAWAITAIPYVIALLDLAVGTGDSLLAAAIKFVVIPVLGYTGAWLLVLPILLGGVALWEWGRPNESQILRRGAWAYSLVLIVAYLSFLGVMVQQSEYYLYSEDIRRVGWLGLTVAQLLSTLLHPTGAQVVIIGSAALALPLLTGTTWADLARYTAERWQRARRMNANAVAVETEIAGESGDLEYTVPMDDVYAEPVKTRRSRRKAQEDPDEVLDEVIEDTAFEIDSEVEDADAEEPEARSVEVINTNYTVDEQGADPDLLGLLSSGHASQEILPLKPSMSQIPYEFPNLKLLREPAVRPGAQENVEGVPDMVEKALARYGVTAFVERIIVGPAITRVECIPSDGTRMNRIASMENDLQFHLAAKSVRVEAPIPGRKAVGIEFPNKIKELVTLREILQSDEYQHSPSLLTVGLG
ncbi:MAG: DNA translocase FtsK 4TM domain-containing protein, partial [bacterium]